MPKATIIQRDRSSTFADDFKGQIWQFGQFDRHNRTVTQDLHPYRVLADLEDLLRILVEILTP